MRTVLLAVVAWVLLGSVGSAAAADCAKALDFRKPLLSEDQPVDLCEVLGGRVVLIVNTASKCAFTPQYEGLEELYTRYRERGLVVAGFPSNDFGNQEPGSEQQVKNFCRLTYGVGFPMFAKTRVRGPGADPLYEHLGRVTGDPPCWNFHKYLLDRQGRVVASFPSQVGPQDKRLIDAIEALL